jgi:hypothetical protein
MLDSLIVQDHRLPDSTNTGSAIGAIETFEANVGSGRGWMKSSRQLEILLAVAPPSTRMSKASESNRARCATAGPGLSQ